MLPSSPNNRAKKPIEGRITGDQRAGKGSTAVSEGRKRHQEPILDLKRSSRAQKAAPTVACVNLCSMFTSLHSKNGAKMGGESREDLVR